MHTVRRLLASDGLFLLHTIGANKTMRSVDPWISKYIFTNGILPSIDRIGTAVTGRFIMEDWHNLGANYDRTLMAWARNFTAGRAAGAFHCSEKVARMFQYYLLSCAGAFRARDLQVWQIVLSPRGLPAVMYAAVVAARRIGICPGTAVAAWRQVAPVVISLLCCAALLGRSAFRAIKTPAGKAGVFIAAKGHSRAKGAYRLRSSRPPLSVPPALGGSVTAAGRAPRPARRWAGPAGRRRRAQ